MASADAQYRHPFGAALAHTQQGIALGVYVLVGLTPPLLALWGSLGELMPTIIGAWRCASLPMQVPGSLVVRDSKTLFEKELAFSLVTNA